MKNAQLFRDWVFEDLLPNLRRYGRYKMEKRSQELSNALALKDNELVIAHQSEAQANNALAVLNNELVVARQSEALARQEVFTLNHDLTLKDDELVIARQNEAWARQGAEQGQQYIVALTHRIDLMIPDVVDKPESADVLHPFVVTEVKHLKFVFTRTQMKYLSKALKIIVEKYPLARVRYCKQYTPNAIHLLNSYKDRLKGLVNFKSNNNTIKILDDYWNTERLMELIPQRNTVQPIHPLGCPLSEWYMLFKVYNRHHPIGNGDVVNPFDLFQINRE